MMRQCLGRSIQGRLFRKMSKTFLAAIVLGAITVAATDPIADLKAGAAALEQKKNAVAITTLEPVVKKLPKIADYAAFFVASAKFEAGDYGSVTKHLEPVFKMV